MGVGWTVQRDAATIAFIEAIGRVDLRTPYYTGSLNGEQFRTTTWQDGGYDCFVWGGDLSGHFTEDGRAFEADETIEYRHLGESPMILSRHWSGRRQ